jgi:hypothetical protein
LTTVNGGKGLEEIGEGAFFYCTLLHEIIIPPAIKKIKDHAYFRCTQLMTVTGGKGLEEIGKKAFGRCTLLQRLLIPPTVREIHKKAFFRCTSLTSLVFCNEIQEFVSTKELMQSWWNHRIHKKSPSTYSFFVKCSIPKHLDLVQPKKWQARIHEMLERIPIISHKGEIIF